MKLSKFFSFAFFLVIGIHMISSADFFKKAKFEPPDGKVLLIVGQDDKTFDEYVTSIGKVPGGFMIYTNIQTMGGLDENSSDYGAGRNFTDEMIKKYPDTVIQIGLYMVDMLKDTYSGKYDKNISKLADWAKKVSIPIFLRIGYECDGTHNHYDPQEYQTAYKYLVDKLKSAGVNNISYVFHAHGHNVNPSLDVYYPGDEYVDWVAFSYFQQGQDMMEPVINFAKKHKKPVMIGESTPMGVGTGMDKLSWQAWFQIYFDFIKKHNIKIISYINSNWEVQPMWKGQGWEDARVQANPYVKKKWLEEILKDVYLQSSEELYYQIGYKNK
ncbi:MAG: endo-1,3-beta-xylanase [uncultured bacterium]|nr:MAG: endo-1,3-beta-xylanase [uncultured bacterium]